MMPDLGRYAAEVLSAYAVSIALIVVLVLLSIRRGKQVKRTLAEAEKRLRNG